MEQWIDIVDFSNKYGISQSTIRRRIRGHAIEYRMEKGKYLLKDNADNFQKAPLYTRLGVQQRAPSGQVAAELEQYNARIRALEQQNRALQGQIAELQTLNQVLEAQLNH